MGVFLPTSGTSFLSTTFPLALAFPFTVGVWAKVTATGANQLIWGNVSSGTDFRALYFTATNIFRAEDFDGTNDGLAEAGTVVANTWYFVLARFISAASRRIDVLPITGELAQGADTATVVASTNNTNGVIGNSPAAGLPMVGWIAEYWLLNQDIQNGGAATTLSTVQQLAYQGPFSINGLQDNIYEYHSFRSNINFPRLQEDFYGNIGGWKGVDSWPWVNNGACIIADHPPLPYSYIRPNQTQRILVV